MISKLDIGLCPEAVGLQELGNELIGREGYDEAVLGNWRQGPMGGFSDNAEHPTTVLTAPFPWLPEGDAERLVEASGLEYPIFSVASAAIYGSQTPTIVRVSLGGTMNQSVFADHGRCSVDIVSQLPSGGWGTASFKQDGMSSDAGYGYGPVDVLSLIDRIRQATQ